MTGPSDALAGSLTALRGAFQLVARCPPWVDAVDKVGDEQRAGNNRIQVPGFLNQCCAPDSYLESMLLTRPSKTFFDSIGTESARDHLHHAERDSDCDRELAAPLQRRASGAGLAKPFSAAVLGLVAG